MNPHDVTQYIGHPINAYNVMKRWYDITVGVTSPTSYESE